VQVAVAAEVKLFVRNAVEVIPYVEGKVWHANQLVSFITQNVRLDPIKQYLPRPCKIQFN